MEGENNGKILLMSDIIGVWEYTEPWKNIFRKAHLRHESGDSLTSSCNLCLMKREKYSGYPAIFKYNAQRPREISTYNTNFGLMSTSNEQFTNIGCP